MTFRPWRPAGIVAALALLFSVAPAGAQQVASQAVLDRVTIVEGQTRKFQISNVTSRPLYHVHASVSGAFTAEAGDITITTDNQRGEAQTVTPDANAPRAYRNATYGTINFEVTANADSDGAGDETFGVRLCTTADCADGTILGEWTVTVTEPAADTTLNGTGATLTIPGGAAVSVMEDSRNRDSRDRRATFSIDITTAPTSDIAVVAYTETGAATGAATTRPFARINSALSPDYPPHGETGHNNVRAEYLVGYWASGATGSQEFTVISTDNTADTPGGTIAGDLKFKVFVDNEAFRTTRSGSSSDTAYGNAAAYSGIAIPDLPVRVTDDDEPTRVRLLPTSPADNTATEGNTDKATVLVKLDRALVAGEEVTALLTFIGATPGTHFTLAAAGGQSGVTYADSEDGARGLVTLAGAGVQEGIIEVTALMDSDSDSQSLQIGMPPFDQPWRPNFHRSNLDGGVCAAHGCPDRPQGDPGQRFQSVTLAEAVPGLTIIEHQDPEMRQVTEGGEYSYEIRLNTAPSNDVTVTVTIASGGTVTTTSLVFTPTNYAEPQTVTVRADNNNNDGPRRTITVTHEFGGDSTYMSLPDATLEVSVLDDDPTTITMAGAGVRPGGSGANISRIMVEGDASRVDRTLTLTLGRALEAGEYVRVPLRIEAVANGNDPSLPDDPPDQGDGDPELPGDLDPRRTTVDSYRGPRASANVAWPPHHNDFVMTATGTGVSYEHSNRYTPNHIGFRYIEFRGAGARTATIVLHARDGFDDGETYDEAFAITFPNDFAAFDEDTDQPFTSSPVDSNLGGGVQAMPAESEAWFGITDDDELVTAVPSTWSLLPPGLQPGDEFRMVYVTRGETAATSTDIATYDAFVREEITGNQLKNEGVDALKPFARHFVAIAGTAEEDSNGNILGNARRKLPASVHGEFSAYEPWSADHPNMPFYWVGGTKVADNNADFTDRDWDDEANPRFADGTAATVDTDGYWTGSQETGDFWSTNNSNRESLWNRPARCIDTSINTGDQLFVMGAGLVWVGYLNHSEFKNGPLGRDVGDAEVGRNASMDACIGQPNTETRPMYALSGVFSVLDEGAAIADSSAAEGAAVTFTVTIPEAAPAGDITIPYTLSNGRGISGDPARIVATSADYADAASGSIVIAQGATTGTITVNTTNDSVYEGDHYFTVTLGTPTGTNPPAVNPTADTAIGTITDDADKPEFEFEAATATVTEGTDTQVSFTVTKTGATEVASSVYWTTADDTASHPGDYTADAGYLQFAPGDTSRTIAIGLVDDADGENAETFKVQLGQPSEATLGGTSEATVTLNDDDGGTTPPATVPTVQFQNAAMVIYEADPIEFPYIGGAVLQSSSAVAADTVVRFTIGGTATKDSDYAIVLATSDTSETILAGETEASFNVRMFGDDLHEPDETVILTLVDGDDYDLGEQTTFTVTIRDLPDVRFAEAAPMGLEGTTATVTINASHAFTEAADVAFTLGGTATAADYTAPTSPVRFSVGATTATISIPITLDMVSETGETIVLTLTDEDGYDLGAQTTHTITLEDNLALLPLNVKFTASGSSVLESAGTATVTVEASRPASEDTDVAFTVSHPSQNAATAGTDYTTPTSPVTIASGQTAATISIPILDDNDDCTEQGGVYSCPDDGEKFILTLTDGADYDLADSNTRHTVTIFEDPVENDDGEVVAGGLATINLTKPRLHLTEGGPSVQYGVSLTRNPMANVDLYVTSPDIGLFTVAGSDGVRYQQIALRFTRRNWDTPQFVAVQAVQDADRDSEQNLLINHAIRGSQADSANFEFGSPYFSHNRGGTGDDSGDDIGVALPDLPVYIADDDAGPDEGLTLEYADADADRPIVIEEGKAATLRLRWSRALTTAETAAARLTITGGENDKDYEVTTDTPNVTVEPLPVRDTKTEFIVTWAKAATNAAAAVKIRTRNDGKRGAGERHLTVELLDAFSADGSAGQNDTPSGVRLKNGPQEERIHVLSRDRLVVRQTTPDGFVFNGLETTGDEAELTTDNAWTEIDEDGSVTHKVKVSLSRPPTNTGDVVVTISTSDSGKLSVAGSDDGDGVADTITWISSGSGTRYGESVTVEFTAEEDGDSDSEVVFVYFTMTSGYGNAHPPGTLVRAFRVDIRDNDAGVTVTPTSLTLTEGANRGERIPGSDPARRTHQIAVRLNTDPGDSNTVVLTPSVYDVKNTSVLSNKLDRDKRQLRFTGGDSGNWNEYQLIGFSAKADGDSDDDEFFLRWNVSNYPGVTAADVPAVTITVIDNDPAVRISESQLDLVEGVPAGSGGARTYDVVLNAPPAAGEAVVVTPTSSDAGAVSFDANSATATPGRLPRFGASNWDRPQRVTIYAATDSDQDDETATITHSVSGGDNYGGVAAPSIAVNVLDKDGPEGIVLSTNSVRVEEGGHPVSFTVRLAGRPSGPVSLNVTGAGSAVSADTDLSTDGAQTILGFTQQNWHRPKTVWLSAEDESDPTDTDDESVTLMVGGTGAPYAALPVAVTVLDDEFTGPTFTVTGSGTLTEGVLAAAIFTVSADIAPAGALPVTLNISETADFVAAADEGDQTLAFSSSRALIRHSVPIDDDSVAEDDGSVTATLKPGSGYRVGTPSSATINVMDDPNDTTTATAAVVVSPTTVTVAENETVTYGINLATDPGGTVTVTPTSGNTSFATVTGQARTFDSTNFVTAQQITVTGVGAGTTSITHAITTGTAAYPTTMTGLPSVDVTVTAAAAVDVTLSASDGDADGNAVEGAPDATGYRTVTLTLGRALTAGETVTVPLAVRGATVTADYAFGLQGTNTGVTLLTSNPHSAQDPAVQFASGASTATLRFTPVDNGDRTQPAVSIGAGTPAATGGVTLGDVTGAPIVFSIVDDETGDITVPADWALKPSGLGGGETFRLIFITSETRTAESADIDDYNTWARGVVARGGHASLRPYGGLVTVIGSTAAVEARENTGVWDPNLNSGSGGYTDGSASASDSGMKIYWLAAPPAHRVADSYFEFHDDAGWEGGQDQSGRDTLESGASRTSSNAYWTGTYPNGTKLGSNQDVLGTTDRTVGVGAAATSGFNSIFDSASFLKTSSLSMMGVSPVFEVATPELSFDSGGAFRVTEGGTATVTVTSSVAAPAATSVAYTVTDVSATGGADYDAPSGAFALTAGATSHSFTIDTTQDTTVEGNETFTVRLDAGAGYSVGSPDTATVTITDDDTVTATPEISMELQTGETSNRNADNQLELAESGGVDGAVFNLSANSVLASTLTVCLQVTEAGGDLLAASAEGIRTATLTSSSSANGAGIYALTWTGDADDERNSVVTATLLAPETAGCSAANGSYTVASAMASDAVHIEDDDATTVALRSSDTQMAEGDATDTATLTVALGRRLYAGEVIVVPFTLATTTGARLPGDATPDFAVSASGAGVTVSRNNTATPSLTFTGHDTNAVQTATVTLTPVAGLDDGDGDHENITATLASDSVLGSTSGSGTTVGGGAMRHGTDYEADLRLVDDEFGAAPELTFASATYSVAEDGGTVAVTVNAAPAPGSALTVNLSSASGTAGLRDYVKPAATFEFPANQASHTVSVGIRDDDLHEDDETFTLTLQAAQDASYTLGSPATATVTITNDDPRPPPSVSVHPSDAIGIEGVGNSASVELRLARALESGETLTVDYRIDTNANANESHAGVTLSHTAGATSTGTLTITGTSAPQGIVIELSPAASTVDRTKSGSRAAEFRLTGVSGVDGASLSPGAESAKVFVNDDRIERRTAIQVSGGSRLGRREFEEGRELRILLDGKAGKRRNSGPRTHDWHNVTVGVQHLTTDPGALVTDDSGDLAIESGDLGLAQAGDDALVGHLRREGDTDYYNVGVLGYGYSAQVRIPILDDAASEGDERFRVFIAETPGNMSRATVIPNNGVRTSYMGVQGAYNSLDAAPGVDFTIKGQPGGGQRDEPPPVAPPPPAPTEAVSNVQVTAVDANNAKVTWDAVEHATSYEVEYETTSTLVDEDNYVHGVALDWTDTEWTFQHDAAEAMTLTVTVTPAYEDGNGDTQALDNLASSATIDVGPSGNGDSIGNGGSTDTTLQQPDYSALRATVRGYAEETQHGDEHVNRWKRALAGLGDGDAIAEGYTPMTADEAQDMADAYSASRWDPIVEALTDLESRQTKEPEPEPIPELSLSSGSAVDEGANASFTIHAHPAPASGVTVSVTVSQSGDYLDSPGAGARTVTLATGAATASLAVATVNDSADEPDGSISVSIDSGAGYTVAPSNHTASVTVRDDDDPPPPAPTIGACVSVSQWDTVKGYYDSNAYRSPNYGANWYRVLIAYHEDRSDKTLPAWVGSTSKPSSAFTVKEAEQGETVWSGWTPVRKVLKCLEDENSQSFVPLLPGSSNPAYGGVVRFVNRTPQGGSVEITATDDSGWSPDPVRLYVGPGQSVDLTTRDLEQGNTAKGLAGYLGWGTGNWRLDVSSKPDASGPPGIEVQPYVRAYDGRLAPMHAIAEVEQSIHDVPTFTPAGGAANDSSSNPAGSLNPAGLHQTGLLRLINRGHEALTARITGTDDSGMPSGEVSVDMAAGESVLLTAAELEGGTAGLRGRLGDGEGMWRLNVASGGDLAVMSLQSADGHLTNLSGSASPALRSSGVHAVPYFPSASDSRGRQGVIRIINDTAIDVPVHVQPRDDTARRYEPLTLVVRAGEAVHLDSWDLERGDPSSGLSGGAGAGMGDWRLDIASWPGVEVLAYVRSLNGALTPVQDLLDEAGQSHEAAR